MSEPKKMDPTMKAKWLAALRSGDYKQGRGLLRTTADEYCCLGVLCDLAEPAGWMPTDADGGGLRPRYAFAFYAMWATFFGMPTPWGVVNLDFFPPAIRVEAPAPEAQ